MVPVALWVSIPLSRQGKNTHVVLCSMFNANKRKEVERNVFGKHGLLRLPSQLLCNEC